MSKKQFKGFNGKTGAKIIAVSLAAGTIGLFIAGHSIADKVSGRPRPNGPYGDGTVGTLADTVIKEPTFEPEVDSGVDTGVETGVETETIHPELDGTVIPEPTPGNPTEDMSVEFIEVLAKLTNSCKDYINTVHGTTPNLTVLGLNGMTISQESGEVKILGQVKVNNAYNYFVATISNTNNLEIYNLPTDSISEEEFVNALDEILSHENTKFSLALNQHITLSNDEYIITEMIETRLENLNSLDAKDDKVNAEISYLNKALNNIDKLELSVLVNDPLKTENGYNFSFSIAVNTGKYLLSLEDAIISKRVFSSTALKHAIENHFDSLAELEVTSTPSTAINEILYIVNDSAFHLEVETEHTHETVEPTT